MHNAALPHKYARVLMATDIIVLIGRSILGMQYCTLKDDYGRPVMLKCENGIEAEFYTHEKRRVTYHIHHNKCPYTSKCSSPYLSANTCYRADFLEISSF